MSELGIARREFWEKSFHTFAGLTELPIMQSDIKQSADCADSALEEWEKRWVIDE